MPRAMLSLLVVAASAIVLVHADVVADNCIPLPDDPLAPEPNATPADIQACLDTGLFECCSSDECPDGTFCNQNDRDPDEQLNTCISQISFNQGCVFNGDCQSGFCISPVFRCGSCASDDDCADTEYCNLLTATSNFIQCTTKMDAGQSCVNNNECKSGDCDCSRRICLDPDVAEQDLPTISVACDDDEDCDSETQYCNTFDTNNNQICAGKVDLRQPCIEDVQCLSGVCFRNTCSECNSQAGCPSEEACVNDSFDGSAAFVCATPIPIGGSCFFNFECEGDPTGECSGGDGIAQLNTCQDTTA